MSRTMMAGRLLTIAAFALALAGWAHAAPAGPGAMPAPPAIQPAAAIQGPATAPGCATAVAGPLAEVLTPAPVESAPAWLDPVSKRLGYCHCGCGPATCRTSADCGGASCDRFPSCC